MTPSSRAAGKRRGAGGLANAGANRRGVDCRPGGLPYEGDRYSAHVPNQPSILCAAKWSRLCNPLPCDSFTAASHSLFNPAFRRRRRLLTRAVALKILAWEALESPRLTSFVASGDTPNSAHGELALRRRFETLEVSMTSVRGVPDELRSAPFG